MKRAAIILAIGLVVAYGISRLPLEQIDQVGKIWGAVFQVIALPVIGAAIVEVITARRR